MNNTKRKSVLLRERIFVLAGAEGLEPSRTVLETGMLPLHHAPVFLCLIKWWTVRDSNPGPTGYEPVALPTELTVHIPLTNIAVTIS